MPLAEDRDGMLSAFRGIRGAKAPGRPAAPMGPIAGSILADLDIGQTSPLETLCEAWASLVPQKFAGISEPSDMGATVLYVRTHNSAAKQELIFEERKILAKISKLPGCSKIRKIRFL